MNTKTYNENCTYSCFAQPNDNLIMGSQAEAASLSPAVFDEMSKKEEKKK